jgi:pimeloyl-ACP methyl ester carboxylesterase
MRAECGLLVRLTWPLAQHQQRRQMTRLIKNAQFCMLPNTTHEVFSERPEWINQIAFDFLKSRW